MEALDPGQPSSRFPRLLPAALAVCSALLCLAAAPVVEAMQAESSGANGGNATNAAPQAGKPDGQVPQIDPVVREVVRMLGAHVSEPVVLHWLETSGRHPAAVGSRELIELKRAGAPDKVTERLLDLAKRRTGSTPAGGGGAGTPGTAGSDPTSGAERATSHGTAGGEALLAAGPHGAPFHWTISYHPNFLEDDERWDLYIYLDGRYLAWAKTPLVSFLEKPLEFDRKLPPGHHLLRLFEERHVRKPNTNEWENQARVAPTGFDFDIAPDTPGKVDVLVEVRTRGGPVQINVNQGGNEIVNAQPTMPQPEKWQPLCDELPKQRGPCRPWTDLWPGVASLPSRDDVRDQLERSNFRPDPIRNSP
jgi:hypothetical protein